MSEVIKVGMADLNVCKAPNVITTLGLCSCIGLVLYDPVTKVGGMVHYMLPDSTKVRNNSNIAKFGDTGIRELLKRVVAAGANRTRLVAKIAGGARMFEVSGLSDVGNIGARNAEEARKVLKELGIRLIAEDTGLNYGRTVELHCDTGEFYIKSVGKPIKIISRGRTRLCYEDKINTRNHYAVSRICRLHSRHGSAHGSIGFYEDAFGRFDIVLRDRMCGQSDF